MNLIQVEKSKYAAELPQLVRGLDALRKDPNHAIDVSLEEMVHKRYGTSMESFYQDLGFNPSRDTISMLYNLPNQDYRYLIPEIIRSSLRLGLRKNPIWSSVVAAEESISQLQATVPHFNMSDAAPKYVGEGETIPVGNISHGSKQFSVRKMGRGFKLTYELQQFCSTNILAIYLQDFGVKLNHAIDTLMIDTLINGEQLDGSESAPVVGIKVPGTLAYRDLLKVWIRMSRIGKNPNIIIGGEDAALDTLDLPEFKTNSNGTTAPAGVPSSSALTLKTPIPKNSDYYIHGAIPADQQLIIDPASAIVKYNAQPLLLETDKIISNQTVETYASLSTGFAILYRDSRIIMDSSLDFATNGFPAYMDPTSQEIVTVE